MSGTQRTTMLNRRLRAPMKSMRPRRSQGIMNVAPARAHVLASIRCRYTAPIVRPAWKWAAAVPRNPSDWS